MKNQRNKYYESIINEYEKIVNISNDEIEKRFYSLERKFNKEEIVKRETNCVYEYEYSLKIDSNRIINELSSADVSKKASIIERLSYIHSYKGEKKLQNDSKLISYILSEKGKELRKHQIELIGRINLFNHVTFLERTIHNKDHKLLPRTVYHYGSLVFNNEISIDKIVVRKILSEIENFSESDLSQILSGLEFICRRENEEINEEIVNYLCLKVDNKKYLDPVTHLYSSTNPGWTFTRIIHQYSTIKTLNTIYRLLDLGVDKSNSLRAIVRIKKEKSIPEILSIAEENYEIARYSLMDLVSKTKDNKLFYLTSKFIQEQDNIDYELNLISTELKELVNPDLLKYLKEKSIDEELQIKLSKLLKVKSITKKEFILDVNQLVDNKIIDIENKFNWDTILKQLYVNNKLSIKMKIENEKDVSDFNNSIKSQLNSEGIEYHFDYEENEECFIYHSSLMNGVPTVIQINGDKKWVLNDPSFFAFYINYKLKYFEKKKKLVQLPPFETHIFTFGFEEKLNSIVNKYN